MSAVVRTEPGTAAATGRIAGDKVYLDAYGARGELQQRVDRVTFWLTGLLTEAPEPGSLLRSVSAAATRSDPTRFLLITAGRVPDEGLAADYMAVHAPTRSRRGPFPAPATPPGSTKSPPSGRNAWSRFSTKHSRRLNDDERRR